jgi:predicted RNA binding protein YcfA (HicA-like mRNA interferase family)
MRSQGSNWHATKSRLVLAALVRIGWRVKRQKGSHQTLSRAGWSDYVFAYHDKVEIGPVALAKLGKKTGLRPEDL